MTPILPTLVSQFWHPPNESFINDLARWCATGVKATSSIRRELPPGGRRDAYFERYATLIFEQCDRILKIVGSLHTYALEYSRLVFSLVIDPRSGAKSYLEGSITMAGELSRNIISLCGTQREGGRLLSRIDVPGQLQRLEEVRSAFAGVGNALKSLSEYFEGHLSHLRSLLTEESFGNDLVSFEDAVIRVHEAWWAYSKSSRVVMHRISKAADFIAVTSRETPAHSPAQRPGKTKSPLPVQMSEGGMQEVGQTSQRHIGQTTQDRPQKLKPQRKLIRMFKDFLCRLGMRS